MDEKAIERLLTMMQRTAETWNQTLTATQARMEQQSQEAAQREQTQTDLIAILKQQIAAQQQQIESMQQIVLAIGVFQREQAAEPQHWWNRQQSQHNSQK